MSWYNPMTWRGGTKDNGDSSLSLNRLIERYAFMRNTVSGERISPESALQSPTVFAIVSRLSRAIASLPFSVYEDQSEPGRRRIEPLRDHATTVMLSQRPNQYQTAYEYWSLAVVRLLLWGRAVMIKRRANGRVIGLTPVDPDHIQSVRMSVRGVPMYRIGSTEGDVVEYAATDLHIINSLQFDPLTAMTPVDRCPETIAMEIAAEKFGATVFGAGAIPNGIISRDGHFKDPDGLKKFKDSWDSAFRKRRGTAVLEDGFKFEPIQMNNEESQFLETRKHQRSVIAGAWGVPPHLVGDLERATFSNIEHMSLDFVNNALMPYLRCIVSAVDRDLLTDEDREAGRFSRFDTSQLLRGDMKSRAEAFWIQRQGGVLSANEWRSEEGRDARADEGGDDYMTPLNFRIEDGQIKPNVPEPEDGIVDE